MKIIVRREPKAMADTGRIGMTDAFMAAMHEAGVPVTADPGHEAVRRALATHVALGKNPEPFAPVVTHHHIGPGPRVFTVVTSLGTVSGDPQTPETTILVLPADLDIFNALRAPQDR